MEMQNFATVIVFPLDIQIFLDEEIQRLHGEFNFDNDPEYLAMLDRAADEAEYYEGFR